MWTSGKETGTKESESRELTCAAQKLSIKMIEDLDAGEDGEAAGKKSDSSSGVTVVACEEYLELLRVSKAAAAEQKKLVAMSQAVSLELAQLRQYPGDTVAKLLGRYERSGDQVSKLVDDVTNQIGITKALGPSDKAGADTVLVELKTMRSSMFSSTEAIKEAKSVIAAGIREAKKSQAVLSLDDQNA